MVRLFAKPDKGPRRVWPHAETGEYKWLAVHRPGTFSGIWAEQEIERAKENFMKVHGDRILFKTEKVEETTDG